jgi:hypothetical protein
MIASACAFNHEKENELLWEAKRKLKKKNLLIR